MLDFITRELRQTLAGAARALTDEQAQGANRVLSIAFSPDGKILASTAGASVSLWDVARGGALRTFQTDQSGEAQYVTFSPDGKTLVFGIGNVFVVFDPTNGQQLSVIKEAWAEGTALGATFSPDGKVLAGVIGDKAFLWSMQP